MAARRSVSRSSFIGSRGKVVFITIGVLLLTAAQCASQHGAIKVASGVGGAWVLTPDGALHAYNGSGWDLKEVPGSADDFEICGTFLFVLSKPNAQGIRTVRSRDINSTTWINYPNVGMTELKQVACDGYAPVVLSAAADKPILRYNQQTNSWVTIHSGATDMSVINGRLFYLYPTTQYGNVWSRDVNGGPYQRWGDPLVADKIAGDANGYPWVAVNGTSNPLYRWDTPNKKWTFGFGSGPVYDMDIDSYVRMFILSDPQVAGGGYTLYSHELYAGGWTKYSLPVY